MAFGEESMKLYVQLSIEDYKNAQWLHLRPKPIIKYIGIIILLMFIIGFIFTIYDSWIEKNIDKKLLIFFGCTIYLVLFFFVYFPYKFKKYYKQQKLIKEPMEIDIQDLGIKLSSPSVNANLTWDNFIKWKEGKKLFILYQTDTLMNILPKRNFDTENDIIKFRQLLNANIKIHLK